MSIDEAVRPEGGGTEEPDEPGWEVDPDDDWALAVIATVGRQLRLRREAIGMRVTDFAKAVGYGEDMVYKVESGKRIPRPDYLDTSEKILRADGLVEAMKEDVKRVRYPKKVRDLAQMESRAVELQLYDPLNIHGLLQTPEYARGLLLMRRPAYSTDEVERFIAARVARKAIFERDPAPEISFVLEEWSLRRPLGGKANLRKQLEHLLEIGELRNVELQVMPMDHEEHAGLAGGIEVLKFEDGSMVGRSQAVANGRPVSDPRSLRILELRYGIIRTQALTPRASAVFIKELLRET
ncbi:MULTISPECIES: helix-turn-helix domain-containing protein [Streptomyces]|uniref:helix-turn-helix domain-containing protein n=1 Tax=Streptomyces TaxID=1883 RepID=UPI0013ADECEA|nr:MULTISPECIES: helix-turn-helix transcriptional regulator [Streptomyces]MBY8865019.1 helix-turn-helix transcriptional regulator [Streptomyces sennicomposti]MYS40612.1 helix-turn-helix domain-containing protein [Streptomyces sp. SID5998]NED37365.1 helix-turn-helix domain-containing protein [Streptomyces sp. SID8499]NED77398.1 helix-turn-helix domain-containing protein [Streptomyces sp. SID9944]